VSINIPCQEKGASIFLASNFALPMRPIVTDQA